MGLIGPLGGPPGFPSTGMPRATSLENVHSLGNTRPPSTGIDTASIPSLGNTLIVTPYSPQRLLPGSTTTFASHNGSLQH